MGVGQSTRLVMCGCAEAGQYGHRGFLKRPNEEKRRKGQMSDRTIMNRAKGRGGMGAAAGVLCAGVVAVAAVAWGCRAPGSGVALASATPATVRADATKGIEVGPTAAQAAADAVMTTLSPEGFTPGQVSHAAGRFNLRVRNRSGQPEVTLRLSKAGGEKVTEVKLTDKVREWTGSFELAAGTYTLSEAGHPDWTCRIEVTPQ
jgi:hypothetical protein